MSRYRNDVLKQPEQLIACLQFQAGEGKGALLEAFRAVSVARHVFIVAIGASWNAGIAVQYSLNAAGIPAQLCDAAEFYHYHNLPSHSVVLFLSRSGKSIEIVQSIPKCKGADATVIAITNDPASPLAEGSDILLDTHVAFDHAISVNTYSSIILTGHLLSLSGSEAFFYSEAVKEIEDALLATQEYIPAWESLINAMEWPASSYYYFLARHFNLASAHEGALLWEEGAKYPATALSTGSFRHGPQEILEAGIRIVLWLDQSETRRHDLQLAADMHRAGAQVLVIGDLKNASIELPSIHIPAMPPGLDPLVNIIPIQLAAERFAMNRSQNPDVFRYCELVVEREGGL